VSKEDKKGWLGSIVVHLVLAVILLLWRNELTVSEPEFLEVSWGTMSSVPVKPAPTAPVSSAASRSTQTAAYKQVPVDLPERSPTFDEKDQPLPRLRKADVREGSPLASSTIAKSEAGNRETGTGLGEKEKFSTVTGAGESGAMPGKSIVGGDGTDAGKSVAFSMQWGDGGKRRLVNGDLPVYPEGVSVEAQIRLEAIVLPSGKVKTLRPVQKGNTRLEDAAMKKVRDWVFEPLGASAPQKEQPCLITFNFILR
jgi:hypothetical protein